MATDVLTSAGAEIRENLVTTAVKFLSNPNVQRCTMESKERFLRSKGLTDQEIARAIEKCSEVFDVPSMTAELMLYHSRRSWLRDRVFQLVVYGGFLYGCYWLYKNCIRRLLFVEEPKRKTTTECIEELRKSLDVMNANITSLRGDVQATLQQGAVKSQLDNLKADIASVKGILLNRNQFPSLPRRAEPPSIPAWQRRSEEATSTETPADDKKPKRSRGQRSESGGSNSSEGEQATKNSDSSLEIIT